MESGTERASGAEPDERSVARHGMDVRRVLDGSFVLLVRHFPGFGPLILVPLVPAWICTWLSEYLELESWGLLVGRPAAIGSFFVLQGLVVGGVSRHRHGETFTLGDCIRPALRKPRTLIVVALRCTLRVVAGLVVLIVPGLVARCAYWVAVPAAVMGGEDHAPALRRSADLTRGDLWQIFRVQALIAVIGFAVGSALLVAVLVLSTAAAGWESGWSVLCLYAFDLGVALCTLWEAVASSIALYELRAARDDAPAAEFAEIFD